MTVNEFVMKTWYIQHIIIVKMQELNKLSNEDLIAIKEVALFSGTVHEFRSCLYKDIYNMNVYSYGVIDNCLIIEVE